MSTSCGKTKRLSKRAAVEKSGLRVPQLTLSVFPIPGERCVTRPKPRRVCAEPERAIRPAPADTCSALVALAIRGHNVAM